MTKVIDENIQRQLDKKISFFVKYFPARIQNVGEDAKAARQLVWAFKDSRDSAYEEVAQMTAKHLKEEYGEKVKSMVLVCVPTSKKENYQSRYMMFCNRVSELTGIGNGFSHVCVLQDRLDVHNHRESVVFPVPDKPKKIAVFSPFKSVFAEQCIEAIPLSGK